MILSGGFEVSGSVVSKDKARDVALIEMKGATVPPLHISGEEVLLGQTAYAVGAPLKEELSGSVTKGIVSSRREIDGYEYIQADIAINPEIAVVLC